MHLYIFSPNNRFHFEIETSDFFQETKVSALDCILFKGIIQIPISAAVAVWKKNNSVEKIHLEEVDEAKMQST